MVFFLQNTSFGVGHPPTFPIPTTCRGYGKGFPDPLDPLLDVTRNPVVSDATDSVTGVYLMRNPSLPVLVVDPKGHVYVKKEQHTLRGYVGMAFDYVLQQFVLIDMVRGILEYLVSTDFETAQLELEYMFGKFS
jgi:hypothetical protein